MLLRDFSPMVEALKSEDGSLRFPDIGLRLDGEMTLRLVKHSSHKTLCLILTEKTLEFCSWGWVVGGEFKNFLGAIEFFYILTSHARCYIISLTMLRIFYWGKYARDKEFVEKV